VRCRLLLKEAGTRFLLQVFAFLILRRGAVFEGPLSASASRTAACACTFTCLLACYPAFLYRLCCALQRGSGPRLLVLLQAFISLSCICVFSLPPCLLTLYACHGCAAVAGARVFAAGTAGILPRFRAVPDDGLKTFYTLLLRSGTVLVSFLHMVAGMWVQGGAVLSACLSAGAAAAGGNIPVNAHHRACVLPLQQCAYPPCLYRASLSPCCGAPCATDTGAADLDAGPRLHARIRAFLCHSVTTRFCGAAC